jgi:hypothetical protein
MKMILTLISMTMILKMILKNKINLIKMEFNKIKQIKKPFKYKHKRK